MRGLRAMVRVTAGRLAAAVAEPPKAGCHRPLGRAPPTRPLGVTGLSPARRCSARGTHLGSVMVTEELRAVCLPRVDEGRSVQAPSGVIPPPNPKIPRGMSEPRLGAPQIHAWAGFSRDWALPGPLSHLRVRELTFIRDVATSDRSGA